MNKQLKFFYLKRGTGSILVYTLTLLLAKTKLLHCFFFDDCIRLGVRNCEVNILQNNT